MASWEFESKLDRDTNLPGAWTMAPLPPAIAKQEMIRPNLKIKGTINRVEFSGSLLSAGGGRYFIVVKKEIRDRIGKEAGDKVKIVMEVDTRPRELVVPTELTSALSRNNQAKEYFEKIAPSHKKAFVDYVSQAKRPETRKNRVAKTVEMLSQKKVMK